MSIGATLRDLRLKRGESLQDVADAVRASRAHIWSIETEKSQNPSFELLKALAEHFRVTLSYLSGEMPAEGEDIEEMIVIYRSFKGLPAEDQATVRVILDSLTKKNRDRGPRNGP
jgi:transcriptional regulator with XRE-family HTH domain